MNKQDQKKFPPRRLTGEIQASIECPNCSIRVTITLYESKPAPGRVMESDVMDRIAASVRLTLDESVVHPVRMSRHIVTVIHRELTEYLEAAQWYESNNISLILDHIIDTIVRVPHYKAYRLWLLNRFSTSQSEAIWLVRKTRPLVVGPHFTLKFPLPAASQEQQSTEELKLGEASTSRPRPHLDIQGDGPTT